MTNVAERLKVLIAKRGTIKAQITNFETYLNKYSEETDPNSLKLTYRRDKLKSVFESFDAIQDEIELLDEAGNQENERFELEGRYFDALATAETLITPPKTNRVQVQESDYESSEKNAIPTINASFKRRIKLPEACLPTFDGRYEEWLSFKDAFKSMIHDQLDLTNVEKLQYLKSTLKGEAARKIQIFSITDDNYTRAWDLLQKSYADKRILIARHLNLFLRLPKQESENPEGLIKLADEAQQHLLSLKSLGISVGDELVVQHLENKLYKSTAEKWDETLKRDVFPTLAEMYEFLYRTATRLANRDDSGTKAHTHHSERCNKGHAHTNNGKRYPNVKKKTFVTSVTTSCPVCKDQQHPLYRCDKFKNLPVLQRIRVVKDASLCSICLRNKHEQKDCKLGNCRVCSERHNTLLHLPRDQPSMSQI